MGAVFHGRHLNLDIEVAVKCLKPELASRGAVYVARFLREAQLAATIHHENLVHVYDVSERYGVHYLVMEYVAGETARERVERKGPLSEKEAVTIVLGAARGLAAAHARTIVHRDVKPDNILISHQGEVKVADLGIAKALDADDGVTATQGVIGTPQYMSPEQWNDSSTVGPAADVWSLGATLFYLLSGRHAIPGGSLKQILRRVTMEVFPECPPGTSSAIAAILRRCTAEDPTQRYANARELAMELEDVVGRNTEGVLTFERGSPTTAGGLVSPPPTGTLQTIKLRMGTMESGSSDSTLAPDPLSGVQRRRALGFAAAAVIASTLYGWSTWGPSEASESKGKRTGPEAPEVGSIAAGLDRWEDGSGADTQSDRKQEEFNASVDSARLGEAVARDESTPQAESEVPDPGAFEQGSVDRPADAEKSGDEVKSQEPSIPVPAALDVHWDSPLPFSATRLDRLGISIAVHPAAAYELKFGFDEVWRTSETSSDGLLSLGLELPEEDGDYEFRARVEDLEQVLPLRIDRTGPRLTTSLEAPERALEQGGVEFELAFDEPCNVLDSEGAVVLRLDEADRGVLTPSWPAQAGADSERIEWTYRAVDRLGNESDLTLAVVVYSRTARELAGLGGGFPPRVRHEGLSFDVRTGSESVETFYAPMEVRSIEYVPASGSYRVRTERDEAEMVLVVPWSGPGWERPDLAPEAPFLLDLYEVTWSRFQPFVEDLTEKGSFVPRSIDEQTFMGSHAVRRIEFSGAREFAAWAGKELPTVDMWLFAATWDGSHGRTFPWGDELLAVHLKHERQLYEALDVRDLGLDRSPWGAIGMGVGLHEWCATPAGSGRLLGSTSYRGDLSRGRAGNLEEEFYLHPETWERRLSPVPSAEPHEPTTFGFRCALRLRRDL